jgi:ABC-type antimicrobial peptide transport system permease subunit
MRRNLLAASLAIVVGLPLGWIISMLMTPALWQLEPILHMELAGHSGPSDRVFYAAWMLILPALFGLFRGITHRRITSSDRTSPNP